MPNQISLHYMPTILERKKGYGKPIWPKEPSRYQDPN